MHPAPIARFLCHEDIPALLRLESSQWDPHQSADASTLRERIEQHPGLCVGAFGARSGAALASLFMRPPTHERATRARRWADSARGAAPCPQGRRADALFGISLTSIEPAAVTALMRFFWPHALKGGWRRIYLGSPMPGLDRALERDPGLDVDRYARTRRGALPLDPQLRYYHRHGFTRLVAVQADYFPHAASRDHGALLCGKVPLSEGAALWRVLPLRWLVALTDALGGPGARTPSRGRARSWSGARRPA
ncbi:MAG: hypothetical protein ABW220_08470 [Burkholderiaceae bacterium]